MINVMHAVAKSSQFESPTPGNMVVKCPVCGDEHVRVTDTRGVQGHDNYKAGWWGRGDLDVIKFRGECDHEFELCFGFHKGNVSVFCRVLGEREAVDMSSMKQWDSDGEF